MELENVFYSLGIVYMVFGILVLIALSFMLFFLIKKVSDIVKVVEEKFDMLKKMADNPAETAYQIGAQVTKSALQSFNKKKRKL